MKTFITTILCLFVFVLNSNIASAADRIWTGKISSDWANADNWNPVGVPGSEDDVKIPDVSTEPDPIMEGGTSAAVKSVDIWFGGILTLEANSELSINSSGLNFGLRCNGGGTIQNAGKINIGNTKSNGNYGIFNFGTFDNQAAGEIHIDDTQQDGIYNLNDDFTNAGKIFIGGNTNTTIGRFGIQTFKGFNNQATGEIHIDNTQNLGLAVFGSGVITFNNWGKIFVGATTEVKSRAIGIDINKVFNNYAGAEIHLDRATVGGISQNPNSTFNNAGKIMIGTNAPFGSEGIRNDGTFNNEATGEIHIDNLKSQFSNSNAILNYGIDGQAVFNSSGKIIIGANQTIEGIGVHNRGQFHNLTSSELTIDRTNSEAILNYSSNNVSFTNAGKISIGENAAIGSRGLVNEKHFENQSDGEIRVYNTIQQNILNRIGATFTNQECAEIYAEKQILSSFGSTFHNMGYIFTNYNENSAVYGTFTNSGIILDVNKAFDASQLGTGGILINKIENLCGGSTFADVFSGSGNYTADTDWYSDEALTMDAGDYDPNTNTFTTNLTTGDHTLYVVFSKGNTCEIKAAIPVKLADNTPVVSSISANDDLCPNQDLQLSTTTTDATQWSWTGPNNFSSNQQNPIIPNATSTNSGDYTLIATSQNGCTASSNLNVQVPDSFSFDLSNATHSQTGSGLKLYVVELCGGTLPYSVDFTSSGGFATTQLMFASGGCRLLQVTYDSNATWEAVITDDNDCSNSASTISSQQLIDMGTLTITNIDVAHESGVGKLDGELTVSVTGGDDSCNEYTYAWTGPNTNITQTGPTTSNTLTGLGRGNYTVIVTDCSGNTVSESKLVKRLGRRGRGRSKVDLDASNSLALVQLQPNPANMFTQIHYSTPSTNLVESTIYISDLMGRIVWVQTLNNEEGVLTLTLDNFVEGLYFVNLQVGNELKDRKKLLIVK